MNSFANVLKKARERAGLTQKEVAAQVGVNDSYISHLERGTSSAPTREKVLAMAGALGITERQERARFLLSAGCGTLQDALDEKDISAIIFVDDFPEQERLVSELRDLLVRASRSQDTLNETTKLISSFLSWLSFYLDGTEGTK